MKRIVVLIVLVAIIMLLVMLYPYGMGLDNTSTISSSVWIDGCTYNLSNDQNKRLNAILPKLKIRNFQLFDFPSHYDRGNYCIINLLDDEECLLLRICVVPYKDEQSGKEPFAYAMMRKDMVIINSEPLTDFTRDMFSELFMK